MFSKQVQATCGTPGRRRTLLAGATTSSAKPPPVHSTAATLSPTCPVDRRRMEGRIIRRSNLYMTTRQEAQRTSYKADAAQSRRASSSESTFTMADSVVFA